MEELILAIVAALKPMIEDAYMQRLSELAATMLEVEFSKGGSEYQKIVEEVQKGAIAWYGLYKPKVYKRTDSLKDPKNIEVAVSDITITNGEGRLSFTVENTSEHMVWTSGFFLRCPNPDTGLHWRPGGDVYAQFQEERDVELNIPADLRDYCLESALADIFGG